ncbi:D-alanine--D-alanine ligase [Candidatus Campbellbacteria bacterium CG10_big_fil_rev_8_21_14_0_10_35_52]|uniref:D-alanine--D-alanine ligase n=1 Tax=Candidatus Campbellbacteria bacterium CG10_big_fil_rev_8_21_14_0_10_35_52 TaxID=1974527 RepID=A0A2M6WV03_9BACT|nr:MAG: D-alanine--D-alanine ligase [Candidatus Campbellbacteria bacterium CG10_big_fil_rev_8_21_14_0_10_35_52]
MQKIRVGVLRGGPSNEYNISLKTGSSVLKNLPEEKYEARDIFISKNGEWHFRGIPIAPEKIINQMDVIFNAMHGQYGEDGSVQRILDTFSVPYTGSAAFASAISMNKLLTKQGIESYDINTPEYTIIEKSDNLEKDILNIFRSFCQPSVIKPINGGSSIGVSLAKDFSSFREGIFKALEYSPKILIEEYIRGREVTCGVIENFRGEELYALMPVEIIPINKNSFFDYGAKYDGKTREICPSSFDRIIKDEIQLLAIKAHKALGLRHYSRSDFIVSPRGIYFLEVNTLPGLTKESLLPKSLAAGGTTLSEFLDHLVKLALSNK